MAPDNLHATVAEVILASGKVQLPELTSAHYRSDLGELGVDSMAALGIMTDLEDRLGVIVDDRQALRLRTIDAIAGYLQELLRSAPPVRAAPAGRSLVLSTVEQPCLLSHRIAGNLLFPFALGLELLVSEWCARFGASPLELTDFELEHPLVVPSEGERQVQLSLEPAPQGGHVASLRQDAERAFFVTRMRATPPAAPGVAAPQPASRWLGPELYGELLPHGEHFRCAFAFRRFGADAIELHLREANPELALLRGVSAQALLTRPVLVDGVLQACGLHALRTRGVWGLPRAAALVRWSRPRAGGAAFCRIRAAGDLRYDVELRGEDGWPMLELQGLVLAEAGAQGQFEAARGKLAQLLGEVAA